MSYPKITVHCVKSPRADRIFWLLEELDVAYNTEFYKFNNFKAPDSLKKLFPLGKSPIVIYQKDEASEAKTLAESAFILQYLLDQLDTEGKLLPKGEKWDVLYYLTYVEGSLSPLVINDFIFAKAKKVPSYWPISWLTSYVIDGIKGAYNDGELKLHGSYLSQVLKENNGYLVNGKFTAADIFVYSYASYLAAVGYVDNEALPEIDAWIKRLEEREAFKKGVKAEK